MGPLWTIATSWRRWTASTRVRRPADQETGWLDFKERPGVSGRRTASEARGELERLLLDACLCLANGEGGVVVLGVADRLVGPAAFVGTDADVDKVKARVYELSSPPLLVDVRERSYSGTRLLELRWATPSD